MTACAWVSPGIHALAAGTQLASNSRVPHERRIAIRLPLGIAGNFHAPGCTTVNHHRSPRKRQFRDNKGDASPENRRNGVVNDSNRERPACLSVGLSEWRQRRGTPAKRAIISEYQRISANIFAVIVFLQSEKSKISAGEA